MIAADQLVPALVEYLPRQRWFGGACKMEHQARSPAAQRKVLCRMIAPETAVYFFTASSTAARTFLLRPLQSPLAKARLMTGRASISQG